MGFNCHRDRTKFFHLSRHVVIQARRTARRRRTATTPGNANRKTPTKRTPGLQTTALPGWLLHNIQQVLGDLKYPLEAASSSLYFLILDRYVHVDLFCGFFRATFQGYSRRQLVQNYLRECSHRPMVPKLGPLPIEQGRRHGQH